MTLKQLAQIRKDYLSKYHPYKMVYWEEYNFNILSNILYRKKSGRGDNKSFNDVIIMADTETSKKQLNHIEIDYDYEQIYDWVHSCTIKWNPSFNEIESYTELVKYGFNFKGKNYSYADILYEELKEEYPYIFTEEATSDIDSLQYIYDYLYFNQPAKEDERQNHNHVVAWTISLRAYEMNIVTLWGRKPSDFCKCVQKMIDNMQGYETIIYFHNLAYDYVFLRKFLFNQFGYPVKQLNTKSHYPILIQWERITLKDSLILAQRSLDKWAKDLDVEHKKALGKWDYNKLRDQNEEYSADELEYIEHDTLAGVECIDKLRISLNKSLFSMPYTATGIPREEVIKRGVEQKAKDLFLRNALTFDQYAIATQVYHGGYTHANRHFINKTISEKVYGKDFASSYPAAILMEKFPSTNFHPLNNKDINYILDNSDNYAFMFKLTLVRPRLKDDSIPMPSLQYSKAVNSINVVPDNGRVLCADYFEIYITELDLKLINQQYDWDYAKCSEVLVAEKDYLPRWFTDYVFELFQSKTYLKGSPDVVAYALAKAKLNSLYGLCVQKSIRDEITEDYESGEYDIQGQWTQEFYDKYLHNRRNILNYQTGVWVTAYAMVNLFELGSCVDYENGGEWLYSDTDSCYSNKWNEEKVKAYNNKCKDKLKANGYGCVEFNDREYWLGIAEDDSVYTEFRFQGAKRYCGRAEYDNQLHITVAGVPKGGAVCLNDNIEHFTTGFVFKGEKTGKLTHQYYYVDDIYIDEDGNETGDSINLIPCDYRLDSVYTTNWESLFNNIEELGGYYGQ